MSRIGEAGVFFLSAFSLTFKVQRFFCIGVDPLPDLIPLCFSGEGVSLQRIRPGQKKVSAASVSSPRQSSAPSAKRGGVIVLGHNFCFLARLVQPLETALAVEFCFLLGKRGRNVYTSQIICSHIDSCLSPFTNSSQTLKP